MECRYKAWKLRNSTDLWRPNRHSSDHAKLSTAKSRERQSASDGEITSEALTKVSKKTSPTRWPRKAFSTFFSEDSFSATNRSKSPSPPSRCRSSSPPRNSRTGNSPDNSHSTGATVIQNRSGTTQQVEEKAADAICQNEDSARHSNSAVLPISRGRDADLQPGNRIDHLESSPHEGILPGRSSTPSKNLQRQVAEQKMVHQSGNTSPELWQEPSFELTSSLETNLVGYDCLHGVMKLGTGTPENVEGQTAEKVFVKPLDLFIVSRGTALTALTRLDLSKVRTRSPSPEAQQAAAQMIRPFCEHLGGTGEDIMLYTSGAFFQQDLSQKGLAKAGEEANDISQDPVTISPVEGQCVVMRANMAFEPAVKSPTICKVESFQKRNKEPYPEVTKEKGEKRSSPSNGQVNQLQRGRPHGVAEPAKSGEWTERHSNHSERSSIASLADAGKETHNECLSKGSRGNAERKALLDSPNTSQLQMVEEDTMAETEKVESYSVRTYIVSHPDAAKEAQSEGGEVKKTTKHKKRAQSDKQPSTCIVTHSKHSIEVSDLQDPPRRRRWPEVPTSLLAISNSKTNAVRPSKISDCGGKSTTSKFGAKFDMYAEETERCLGRASVLGTEDRIDEASHPAMMGFSQQERALVKEEVTPKESLAEISYLTRQYEHISRSVEIKKELKISVPCDSVREICIEPGLRRLQATRIPSEDKGSNSRSEVCPHLSVMSPTPEDGESYQVQVLEEREGDTEGTSNLRKQRFTSEPGHGISNALERPVERVHIPEQQQVDLGTRRSTCTTTSAIGNSIPEPQIISDDLTGTGEGQPSNMPTPDGIKFTKPSLQEDTNIDRASLSSEKLCSILSYLGHVEESNLQDNYSLLHKAAIPPKVTCSSPSGSRSPRTVLEHDDSVSLAESTFTASHTTSSLRSSPESSSNLGEGDMARIPAISLFEGVRKKMQQFKDKITARDSQNAELLRELERLKADKEQALSLERDKFGRELEVQAAEYKAAIQHHLSLNEKMVKDKETLSEKCCNLAAILSTAESKFEEKVKALKDQFAQDLKKHKEIWIAGEKPRREAWKEKTMKEIKEITIKGLEPHIEGIVEKHKQEARKMETRYTDETQKKLELQAIQHRQEICDLRNRLLKDRDELLEKERMAALTRMNDVAEKYEQQAMQLRMRVSSETVAELEKVEEARRQDKQHAHALLSQFQKEAAEREDVLRRSLERAMHEAMAERDAEINLLRAQIEKDMNEWQKAFDEKLCYNLHIKEKEFEARCKKERDEQIEMIIERMENEKEEAIAQHQQELLVKVERLMEEKLDFMKRIKEVESRCAKLCQLSLEAKQKAEKNLENRDMKIESLERELSCQTNLVDQLKSQINQEKKNLDMQEERFAQRLEKEQDLLQSALMDIEQYKKEAQQMRARKAEELGEVEAHVRQAIENKDLVITSLREQLLAAHEQIRHTELLLQQEQVSYAADPD